VYVSDDGAGRVELHRKRGTTLKLRSISRGFFLVNSVKERKKKKKKEMRTDSRRNYLFGRTENSRWQNGAFSIRRICEVVSLSQHWVIPSKLRSTNSHDYGPASLYCCFEWPVRSGSRVRDEASRERSSRRYGGWMLLWIYYSRPHVPRFDRNLALLTENINFSPVSYIKFAFNWFISRFSF